MKLTEKQLRKIIRESINGILNEYNLATKMGQEDYMWNKYGNRSVVPDAGAEHEDDFYTRKNPNGGELAMQVLGLGTPDDPLWAENGKDPKWRSPKGYVEENVEMEPCRNEIDSLLKRLWTRYSPETILDALSGAFNDVKGEVMKYRNETSY